MKKKQINSLVGKALLLGTATSTITNAPISAAETDGANEETKIVITGSRIKRVDTETAMPVQVFDAEFIQASGANTLQDFLFQSNIAGPNIFNENTTLSQTAGTANFDARGFGDDYVLVLLNGRRLPGDPLSGDSATNLNLIPLAAIERLEFLSDGASAIYGADAISGVINIITRTDMDGANLSLRFSDRLEGDSGQSDFTDVSYTMGMTGEKSRTLISFNWSSQDNLNASGLPLIGSAVAPDGTDGRSPVGLPATLVDLGNDVSYVLPECPQDLRRAAQFTSVGEDCSFDVGPYYDAIPAQTRQSIFATSEYDINTDLTLYSEFRYSQNFTEVRNGAAPANFNITGYSDFPELDQLLGSDLTNSSLVFVTRRMLDAGPRATDNTNSALSAVFGLSYYLDADTEFNLSYQSVDSEQNRIGVGGQLSKSRLSAAVISGLFNPLEIYDPQFFIDNGIAVSNQRQALGEEKAIRAEMNGVFDVGESELGYAFGLEMKDKTFVDRADVASSEGDIAGGASSNGGGESSATSWFGELAYSPVDDLELSLAVRYDDFSWGNDSSSGQDDETTYRIGASYRASDNLLLRASAGTGFKAPTLGELFLGRSFGVTRAVDTTICNQVTNDPNSTPTEIQNACRTLEIRSVSGGNSALKTESSESYSFGLVFQPLDDWSVTLDYYNIEVSNKIGRLTVQEIIDNEAQYPNLVTRVSGTLTAPGAQVRSNLQNLSMENGSGVDLTSRNTWETDTGKWALDLRAAYLLSHETQISAVQPLCDDAGTTSEPEIRLNGQLSWKKDDLEFGMNMRYLDETTDMPAGRDTENFSCDNNPSRAPRKVDSYLEMGAYGTYTFGTGTRMTVGIRNLTDEEPPFSEVAAGAWPWFDQALYDVKGRNYYIRLNHDF